MILVPPSDLAENSSGILSGGNTDEGTSFNTIGLNTTWDLFTQLQDDRGFALTPEAIHKILELYPDDPANTALYPPHTYPNSTIFPQNGLQWRRDAAIAGVCAAYPPKAERQC
jgi:cholinesterase